MTLLRKIFYYTAFVALASVVGTVVGLFLFYGSEFVKKVEADPSWPKTLAARALEQIVASSSEEGFFYKPLLDQNIQVPQQGKAIHADLRSMRLKLYKDGAIVQEFPIISKGRPGSFWETPTGEYKVLTKEENHFSSIGSVWMPYSIGFFGNFFIHGWPYYATGKEVPEGFSGGCIRMKTEDAKIVYGFVESKTPIIVTDQDSQAIIDRGYTNLRHQKEPQISAEAFLVGDLDNNYVFSEKDRSSERPIASVTKLMSAVISLEAINQERDITITQEDLDIHGDSGELKLDELFKAKELLPPLLLASSNDAAYALARSIGVRHFVDLMNKKAEALGLVHTHFTDPSGLEMTNVSSPEELMYLLKYVRDVRSPLLATSKERSHMLQTDKALHEWHNFNWPDNDPSFKGGKVGYIDAAGHTMVALFRLPMSEFQERDIGIVVLGSKDERADVKKLAAWVKENFVYSSTVGNVQNVRVSPPPPPPATSTQINVRLPGSAPTGQKTTMLFVGDIMMDRGIRAIVEKHGGDYSYPFAGIHESIAGADIAFGNLEGPISDKGSNRGSIYSFRMDPKAASAIAGAGFDIVSMANNHMGDWGREAMEDTFSRLHDAGVQYVGAGDTLSAALEPTIIERNGMKIGFLAFSDVGPVWMAASDMQSGIALARKELVTDAVLHARSKTDILIVSFHFGEEYTTHSNTRQQDLARAAIDAGAKLVVGHHPHVAEEIEKYHGGVIAYSLGNFIFDQAFSPDTKKALMLKMVFDGTSIDQMTEVPIEFNTLFQPHSVESSSS